MLNRNHSPQEYIGIYIEFLKCKKRDLPKILEIYSGTLKMDNAEKLSKTLVEAKDIKKDKEFLDDMMTAAYKHQLEKQFSNADKPIKEPSK